MSSERQREKGTLAERTTGLTSGLEERDKLIKELMQSLKGNTILGDNCYLSLCKIFTVDLALITKARGPLTEGVKETRDWTLPPRYNLFCFYSVRYHIAPNFVV